MTLAHELLRTPPTAMLREALSEAREASERSRRPTLAVAVERVPAEPDPLALFRAASGSVRAAIVQPQRRFALVAAGVAASWRPSGAGPLAEAAEFQRSLPFTVAAREGAPFAAPILLGGFAFQPGPRAAHWAPFGDGLLVAPRTIFLSIDGARWRVEAQLVGEAGRVPQEPDAVQRGSPQHADRAATRAEWTGAVLRVLERIAAGEAQKVVLAREALQEPARPVDDVLASLIERFPSCTIFAFDLGGSCFLGATPERLAAVDRGVAEVMALAGTTRRGASATEDEALAARLLADRKEREEHAYVVEAIVEALEPLVERAEVDPEPHVFRLPHLQHLRTFVRGRLRPGRSLLDLAARLHPTPAVGGIPRAAAVQIIREVEGFDRGWYAGPVGWVDAKGDGEFVVALRSALLVPGDRARLFAGCGVVARSDPEREFEESELKLEAMRSALRSE